MRNEKLHTINAANVGSTRDLISQKHKNLKTVNCKADISIANYCFSFFWLIRSLASSWFVRVNFLPSSCWPLRFEYHLSVFRYFFFISPAFTCQGRFFFFHSLLTFVMPVLTVCMYRKSIFESFVISYFSLCFIAGLFSFIGNQAS